MQCYCRNEFYFRRDKSLWSSVGRIFVFKNIWQLLKYICFWFRHPLCDLYLWIFGKKENSIFILIFNKAAAINYFEHLFRSPLTCTQYNEFIYTPLLSSLMHTIVIILLNAYTIYFLLNWYSTNFLGLFMARVNFSQKSA